MAQVLLLRGCKTTTMTGSVFWDLHIRNADLDRLTAGKIDLIVFANAAPLEPPYNGNTDQGFPPQLLFFLTSQHHLEPRCWQRPLRNASFCVLWIIEANKCGLLSLFGCWHTVRNILNFLWPQQQEQTLETPRKVVASHTAKLIFHCPGFLCAACIVLFAFSIFLPAMKWRVIHSSFSLPLNYFGLQTSIDTLSTILSLDLFVDKRSHRA